MRRSVALLAVAAVLVRLPHLGAPLSPDEAGFLMVGGQWHPGSSLYGDYWVDRPPLLIALFQLLHLLGGGLALRLLGCLCAGASVVLAHRLGRVVTGRSTWWPAAATAAFVSMPVLGTSEVDGELICLPIVLAGLLLVLHASRAAQRRWWVLAGVIGACAPLLKQNFVDVFVFATVLVLAGGRSWLALRQLGALLAGAALTGAVTLVWAISRGTTVAGLWHALVLFRLHASTVIGTQASAATPDRLHRLLVAFLASGALVVAVLFVAWSVRRLRQPLVLATVALLAWELFGVLAGGSYWLHYLVGVIPALTLAVVQLGGATVPWRAAARGITAYAGVVAVVTSGFALTHQSDRSVIADQVVTWLRDHGSEGDTGVILYGSPDVLWRAGLTSPYDELWSLPVRVRDRRLRDLTSVLRSPRAPTWVIAMTGLDSWGIDSDTARQALNRRYQMTAVVAGVPVFRLRERGQT